MHETLSRQQLNGPLQLTGKQLTGQLQLAIQRCEGFRADAEGVFFSSGCEGIDRLLPQRGLKNGMVVEWLAQTPGCAAGLIGLINCREACKQGGMLMVIDRQHNFYPPVALAWGVEQSQLIVLHPATQTEHIWAMVQALESPAVTAVWSPLDRIDSKTFQRLRMAAQTGNTLGVLLRPAEARGQPSWCDAQFWVKPVPHQRSRIVEVYLARSRGAKSGGRTVLDIDASNGTLRETTLPDTLLPLRLATQLADPKNSTGRTEA